MLVVTVVTADVVHFNAYWATTLTGTLKNSLCVCSGVPVWSIVSPLKLSSCVSLSSQRIRRDRKTLEAGGQTWRRRHTAPPWCEVFQSDKSAGRTGTDRDSYQNKTPSAARHSRHTPTRSSGRWGKDKKKEIKESKEKINCTHLQNIFLWITCQQFSQSGVWEFLQCAGAKAPLQTSDINVDETLIRVPVDPAGQTLLHHGYLGGTRTDGAGGGHFQNFHGAASWMNQVW